MMFMALTESLLTITSNSPFFGTTLTAATSVVCCSCSVENVSCLWRMFHMITPWPCLLAHFQSSPLINRLAQVNTIAPSIISVILLIICHTILMMVLWRN